MLETIRQFAWEQLESHRRNSVGAVASHAQYCLAYLKRTAPARMRDTDNPPMVSLMMSGWRGLTGM